MGRPSRDACGRRPSCPEEGSTKRTTGGTNDDLDSADDRIMSESFTSTGATLTHCNAGILIDDGTYL